MLTSSSSKPEVDLSDVSVFLMLSHELHFGHTGSRLGLSQARVSQIIRRLERAIGAPLLIRTSRRVELTALGERLRDHAGPHMTQLRAAIDEITAVLAEAAPILRLGMVSGSTSGGLELPKIVKAFQAKHPGCRVRRVEVSFSDPLGPLRRAEVDLMCLRMPIQRPDIAVGPILASESRVLLVERSHPLAEREAVEFEVLGDLVVADAPSVPPEMLADILPWTTPLGRPVPRGPRIDSVGELLAGVAAGEIAHCCSAASLAFRRHPDVAAVPITDAPPTRTALATLSQGASLGARAFIAVANQSHISLDALSPQPAEAP